MNLVANASEANVPLGRQGGLPVPSNNCPCVRSVTPLEVFMTKQDLVEVNDDEFCSDGESCSVQLSSLGTNRQAILCDQVDFDC